MANAKRSGGDRGRGVRSMLGLGLWAGLAAGCGGGPEVVGAAEAEHAGLAAEDAPEVVAVGAPQVDLDEDAPEAGGGPGGAAGGGFGARGAVADGGACATGADCASGVCEGQGCDGKGPVCASRMRMCTKDLRPYCGCNGRTFRSSGSCPGQPYSARGECAGGADEDAP